LTALLLAARLNGHGDGHAESTIIRKLFQVRQIRTNIERNVYQEFLLQNIEFISETLEKINSTNQNQSLQNDFNSIVWFMISKFPTKIISSKVLFEPLKKCPVVLLTILDKPGFLMLHKLPLSGFLYFVRELMQ